MNEGQGYVRTLLESIRQAKGPAGRVTVHAFHWSVANGACRGIIASRGIEAAGAPAAPPPPPDFPDGGESPEPPLRGRWDGVLRAGEDIEFAGRSPRDGCLHLFNLGLSGTCVKLAPSAEHPNSRVRKGEVFRVPSDALLSARRLPRRRFVVLDRLTADHGEPDRLLVIVTADDEVLQLEDLHPKLIGRDLLTRCPSRGAGFAGPPHVGLARLFALPPERWDYGLLEMEVVA